MTPKPPFSERAADLANLVLQLMRDEVDGSGYAPDPTLTEAACRLQEAAGRFLAIERAAK